MRHHFLQHTVRLCVLALCVSVSVSAFAQTNNPQHSSDPWTVARDAYRAQDWQTARSYTAAASQRDPKEPRYYLSLARIAFQQGEYEDAVWFYDLFIEYARDQSDDYSGTYAPHRAEAERKSANGRRETPTEPPQEPDAQVRVRNALLSRLKEGAVIRKGGGGALATFETLMRIGYANPDIEQLRTAVSNAAGEEADRMLERGHGRLPALSYPEWKQQAERYEAAYKLIPPPVPFEGKEHADTDARDKESAPKAKAYQRLSEAQRQYLLHNWSTAARLFHEALEIHPTLHLAHQGRLNALLASNSADAGTLSQALKDFEAAVPNTPDLPLYRAMVTAAMKDSSRASSQLLEILTNEHAGP